MGCNEPVFDAGWVFSNTENNLRSFITTILRGIPPLTPDPKLLLLVQPEREWAHQLLMSHLLGGPSVSWLQPEALCLALSSELDLTLSSAGPPEYNVNCAERCFTAVSHT